MEFGTGTAPPPMPHRGHGKDDPPFRFLTFDAVPRGSILFAGPVYIRVQYGEDKRLDKDWTQFWACLVRGLLLVFSPGGSSQVKSFVACIDLHQLQARLATKEETKKKNALFIETAQKVGYLLRTDDEGEVMSWMATISAACVDGSAAEKELADQIRSFATLIDSQGEPVTKKDKISWKSMGGFLANLGGGGKPALADASPPAARKPFSDSQASLNQLRMCHRACFPLPLLIPFQAAPTTCFGGRLADQVANQQRPIPFLVETCIRQIEAHGILSEGIYRISGNAASVQRLKILFNTGMADKRLWKPNQ